VKQRGIIVFLLGVPAWIYVLRFFNKVSQTPFGSELGSAAFPIPLVVKVVQAIAILLTLTGFFLLATDFNRWRRRRLK
jgi:hypothetical protein